LDESPIEVTIPVRLSRKTLMEDLTNGLGYSWHVFKENEVILGRPRNGSFWPELVLIRRSLWMNHKDISHKDRLEHTLKLVAGGKAHG
jgi:hypothetical protein